MSLGNGNPKEGDKGSNFNYELKVLQGLESIAVALETLIPASTRYYGSFYDTTTQSVASGGIKAMELNTTDPAATSGFVINNNGSGRPTRITALHDGVYNLQFSAQLNRTTGGSSKQIDIWIAVDGLDIPNSATGLNVQANANKLVAAWNFFVTLNAGSYVELMWTQDDAIDILYQPAGLFPAIPSVIATINKVS